MGRPSFPRPGARGLLSAIVVGCRTALSYGLALPVAEQPTNGDVQAQLGAAGKRMLATNVTTIITEEQVQSSPLDIGASYGLDSTMVAIIGASIGGFLFCMAVLVIYYGSDRCGCCPACCCRILCCRKPRPQEEQQQQQQDPNAPPGMQPGMPMPGQPGMPMHPGMQMERTPSMQGMPMQGMQHPGMHHQGSFNAGVPMQMQHQGMMQQPAMGMPTSATVLQAAGYAPKPMHDPYCSDSFQQNGFGSFNGGSYTQGQHSYMQHQPMHGGASSFADPTGMSYASDAFSARGPMPGGGAPPVDTSQMI